ncbi:MAG: enoyl-CoA hydratase [Brevundimonas sp.]|uniref:Enoyl-CoA hydratase-related protein n=1 Tax=Brevundimonas albigilva TaxID=1312364 RepID=A0ABY4SQ31_9CAUL|nr:MULTISPECIES: enoyl-CoA hydratase-related protein [Brevundimonas]PZU62018.1 MAG: enoyl-CoA hydratase [Brevundimonas sp.]UQV18850.1 enoyl-CoA hydratase-related protein [Brevundimonas albigilva]URI16348.1 enoyl-CoA hydratase-related protein [Brevundimonas albigilva]
MTDRKPTEADLEALDVTDAEEAEINRIAHPLVADPAPDANDDLVQIDATADGVVFVTINRSHKKNAFDAATIAALHEAFETLHGADRVRVVFIRGAGGTFSAGADLNWMRDAAGWSEADNRTDAQGLARMLKALHDVPALTVAVVEGSAMGGGAGIVAACDMAVAVAGARFAFSEVKLGLIPATIAPYVIEAVGARRARQLFLTGNIFDADYAAHAGLIDMVLPEGSVDQFIEMLSDSLSANAPGAMGDAKRLVHDLAHHKIDTGLIDDTARRIARARVSDEGREGVAAFLDKRPPNWAG